MGEQAAAATAGRGCNWIPRAGPHSQNKTHFHPIPSLPIHENSFSCAPAPTPNARLASDAGPSPQRLRKKSSLLHSQKKGEREREKKASGSSESTKETCFIHKSHPHSENEVRRWAIPVASNLLPTPHSFRRPLLNPHSAERPPRTTPMQASPRILHEAPASLGRRGIASLPSRPQLRRPQAPSARRGGSGGLGVHCPFSNLPGPQKFGQILHSQAAHVGVI